MHGSSPFPPSRRPGSARLGVALFASLLLHGMAGGLLPQERHGGPAAAGGGLEVRLQPMPPEAPPAPAPPPLAVHDEPPLRPSRGVPAAVPPRDPAADVATTPRDGAALPAIPDLTVYGARDLDSYPRPVAPIALSRFARARPGGFVADWRVELIIDEQGSVSDLAWVGPRREGVAGDELRALLAATRFVPARKDGRAVRSRVVLEIRLEPEPREP